MNSVTRASLSQVLLKNLPVLLPPKEEQQAIAEHLDTYCEKVDKTVKELQDQIADLKLYKQSIISEAVTGKINVID
jgi:type I restriction enzyme S subunit